MMCRSKVCGLTLALAFCSIQLAAAADLPAAAPVYKAAPSVAPYNWTGFYAGGNVGYSWGRAASESTEALRTFFLGLPAVNATFVHSDALALDGIIGGGQIGYNWQVSPNWVYGLEADWQAASERASLGHNDPYVFPFGSGVFNTNYEAKISWFGTARGRIGYAWDRLLIYTTAGLAYGQVKLSGTMIDSGVSLGSYSATAPLGMSRINAGWTAGVGVEGAIVDNWSWKLEYLYVDLGSLGFSAPGPFAGETLTTHIRFNDNILRLGVNLRFH